MYSALQPTCTGHRTLAKLLLLLVGAALVALPGAPAWATMWACDYAGNLYTVNTSNAQLSFVGNTGLSGLGALEFAPDGTLYGIRAGLGNGAGLYRIDKYSAAASWVGSFQLIQSVEGGLVFAPDGTAYGVHDQNNSLYTIDVSTGAATAVAMIDGAEYHDINGLAWRGDGMLVGLDDIDRNELVTINPLTGALATITTFDFGIGGVGGMATDIDGVTYFGTGLEEGNNFLPVANGLFSVDLYTGAHSFIGEFNTRDDIWGVSGLAADPIPEPGTLLLFGIGLAGAAAARRRLRKS